MQPSPALPRCSLYTSQRVHYNATALVLTVQAAVYECQLLA